MRPDHVTMRFLPLLAGAILLVGCDNRPTASKQPLPLYCEFYAFHLEDERSTPSVIIDTVYVYFAGSGLTGQLAVRVNEVYLPQIAWASGEALYAAHMIVSPGGVFRLDVANDWRSTRNEIIVPGGQPRFSAPVSDSLYGRYDPIIVRWTGADTGTVQIGLDRGAQTGSLGESLWLKDLPASDGSVSIPSSVWDGVTDSTAVLTLWYAGSHTGEGFQGGLNMATGFGVRRLVRVSGPGTAAAFERSGVREASDGG